MKKLYIALTLVVSTFFLSCDKFLERPPEAKIPEEEALKTEDDVVRVLYGCFFQMGVNEMYNGKLQSTAEYLADHLNGSFLTGKAQETFNRRTTIFNTDNNFLYVGIYNIVYRANKALEKIELVSEPNRAIVEGRIKMVRAICHFELARMWSFNPGYSEANAHPGIPIRLSTEVTPPVRASVKEVYDQIIKDLKEAEASLPDFDSDRSLGDKNTARAFLAKVYFQMNNFADAYHYADLVIKSGKYPLEPTLKTRYSPEGTAESILRIKNLSGSHEPGGTLRGTMSGRNNPPAARFTQGFYDFVAGFPGDNRIEWLNNTRHTNVIYVTKYDSSQFELPIITITEMYLTRAEAGGEIADTNPAARTTGIEDINRIIERAYGNDSRNLPSTASADLLIQTARTQREIELMGEGDRLHQIARIGANPARRNELLDRRGAFWNCPGFILQFPDYERNANVNFQMNVEGGCL